MPRVTRVSDIVEEYGEKAVIFGLTGVLAAGFSALLFVFRGQGALDGLAAVLGLYGVGAILYAATMGLKARKVEGVSVTCPYCQEKQLLAADPIADFPCTACHRMIPVQEGAILSVEQVRCGYCNELNYYSAKTEVLLCESCNHEIPISTESGVITKRIMPGFAVTDDERLYQLTLVSVEHKSEELISALQSILALNRNQVKNMLEDLPALLLTGIPRKKAEMMQAQLSIHEAKAEFSPLDGQD